MHHKGTIQIETERLILRRFTADDAQAVYTNWASDEAVTRYLTWSAHQSVEDSIGFMNYCVRRYDDPSTYEWGIELKDSRTLIGSIAVVSVNDDLDSMELGWAIGRKYWGNGYTAEAARAIIDFLFDQVGANRIGARHDTNNPNSGRVMQKAGMRYEGTLRQNDRNNQGIVDCCCYSILKSDRQTL